MKQMGARNAGHRRCSEAKSARCVRRGGGWRRGMAETPRPRPARQSSTLLGRGCRKSAEFGNSTTPYSTVLSRARSPDGASSVLVLAPLAEQPEPAVLARLEWEYALADELDGAW